MTLQRRGCVSASGRCSAGAALLIALTACNTATPEAAVVRDSAGIQIVENAPGAMERAARWTIAVEPSLRVGGADGDSAPALGEVADGVRLDDGRIVVADLGASQLRAFDPRGRLLWQQGGPGEGPGEYRLPQDLVRLAGDTLAVYDGQLRRIVVVTPDGEWVRTVPVEARIHPGTPGVSPPLATHQGRLFAAGPATRTTEEGYRWQVIYLLDPADGSAVPLDTIHRQPSVPVPGGRPAWPRFGWVTQMTASDAGLYVGTGQAYEVGRYGADMELEQRIRWVGPDRTITDDDVEAYFRGYAQRSSTPPSQEPALRQTLETIPLSDQKPAYFELRTDRGGNLWVRDVDLGWLQPPDTLRWTVFDSSGRLTARAEMPGHVLPLEIGEDYVLGRVRGADGLEWVGVYGLVKEQEQE